jgi:HAD superfamily hydrolase (TIGR01490 family)
VGRVLKTALAAPRLALAELQDRRMFNELLFQSYEGTSEDRLHLLADECFDKVIKPALFPHARDLVSRCRDEGHEVVIISGALDFLMRHLADHLGATDVIANRLEIKDGHATGRLLRPVVAGPEKARLVRDHAKARGFDLDHCFAYSDSYSDVPMLSVVARTYGWPVLELA